MRRLSIGMALEVSGLAGGPEPTLALALAAVATAVAEAVTTGVVAVDAEAEAEPALPSSELHPDAMTTAVHPTVLQRLVMTAGYHR